MNPHRKQQTRKLCFYKYEHEEVIQVYQRCLTYMIKEM